MRKAIVTGVALSLMGGLLIGATGAPAGGKKQRVVVGNNFFTPANKTIRKGTLVKFKWTGGGAPHNVTKTKGPGKNFQSKTTSAAGVHFKKRLRKRGKYKFICTIHPSSMRLTLKVR